jgi:transposase
MKIIRKTRNNNNPIMYDHYIAIDWSKDNAAIARMRSLNSKPQLVEFESNVKAVKEYLKKLHGKKILTIEETTTAHWLYVELKGSVDKILICDPYRNQLLSEGPKTDRIDAVKLCQLLRSGLLKEVYHSLDEDYKIRKLVSAYEDLVKASVRVKNQKAALYLAEGLNYKKDKLCQDNELLNFVDESQSKSIELYKEEKKKYENLFSQLGKKNALIKNLCQISGVGLITAVTIYSKVIDANRFENKYKYWSYCGLVKNEKRSGGKLYGKRNPRYSHRLKWAYKAATLGALSHKNDIREYYECLVSNGLSADKARNEIARYIAKVSYGMMKNGTEYIPYKWREPEE